MVHGYHAIWGTYGFWLPNDPRGSWSDMVYSWELTRFGRATRGNGQIEVEPEEYAQWRTEARKALKYPAVTLTELQVEAVATGFKRFCAKSGWMIWECSIMPEHVHLVLARHRYKCEIAVNLLKGEATKMLLEETLHPMSRYRTENPPYLPSMWAERQWITFLDNEEAIDNAIRYVKNNPTREGRPPQCWDVVQPFHGLDSGLITYD